MNSGCAPADVMRPILAEAQAMHKRLVQICGDTKRELDREKRK